MVKKSYLACFAFALIVGLWGLQVNVPHPEQVFYDTIYRTVRIVYTTKISNLYGELVIKQVKASGIIIAKDKVLTCQHIFSVAGIGSIELFRVTKDGIDSRNKVSIFKANKDLDLCLVTVSPEFDIKPVRVASREPYLGDDIFFVSYSSIPVPALRFWKYTTSPSTGINLFPVYFGDSGGGVYNMSGELIGVITHSMYLVDPVKYYPMLGKALDLDTLNKFLSE